MVYRCGSLEPMQDVENKADEWIRFHQRFKWFGKANDSEKWDPGAKVSMLLLHIGDVGQRAFNSFAHKLTESEAQDFALITAKFDECFLPPKTSSLKGINFSPVIRKMARHMKIIFRS